MHNLGILGRFNRLRPKLVIACCVLLGALAPLTINAAPGETKPVSVGLPGFGANGASANSKISANGQFVVFESTAPDLVVGDTNGLKDIFVYNRLTRETVRASVSTSGREGKAESIAPSISGDGRFVAFESEGFTFTQGYDYMGPRIFVRDMVLGTTIRIGSSPPGVTALAGWSQAPSISSDGRYVAYHSSVNVVPDDTNGKYDIFVYDMVMGSTIRASLSSSGVQGNQGSKNPSMSSDGRYVAYTSEASNFALNDSLGNSDIFRRDLDQATTVRVSVSTIGGDPWDDSDFPSISADGNLICFTTRAGNLVPGDNQHTVDAFVRDVSAGTTRRASLTSTGSPVTCVMATISEDGRYVCFTSTGNVVPPNQSGWQDAYVRDLLMNSSSRISEALGGGRGNDVTSSVSLSANGQVASFASDATNMVAEDRNRAIDVFVRDLSSLENTLISNPNVSSHGNDDSLNASINSNGRFVAYTSEANNIVLGDNNEVADVFLHDSNTGLQTWVSLSSQGVVGNGASRRPSISNDGRYIAFESASNNWVPGDTNNSPDIFVRDTLTGTTTLVSVSTNGLPGNGTSEMPAISASGRYVAFHSTAANLVVGDSNGYVDLFVRDLHLGITVLASVSTSGAQGHSSTATPADFSDDGRFVAFCSWANNLVPNDTNLDRDVFVRDLILGTTIRANLGPNGEQAEGSSNDSSISSNGRFVAFSSNAYNFFNDQSLLYDVFVRDLETQTTKTVSLAALQGVGESDSGSPEISADGRFVAFFTYGGFPNATGPWGILVRDLYLNMTYACNVNFMGEHGNDGAFAPSISGDGRIVAFESASSNLTSLPKSRAFTDVFYHEVAPPLTLNLTFSDWLGGQPPSRVEYQVKSVQGTLFSAGAAIFGSANQTQVPRPPFGEYFLTIKAPRFLVRKKHFLQSADTTNLGSLTLTNGDVDGSGEVDAVDIDIVISRLGTTPTSANWLEEADLNGSDEVDPEDIDVCILNFGAVND